MLQHSPGPFGFAFTSHPPPTPSPCDDWVWTLWASVFMAKFSLPELGHQYSRRTWFILLHQLSPALATLGKSHPCNHVGLQFDDVTWCHNLGKFHDVITEPVLMKSKPGRAAWCHSWAGFVMLWLRLLLWHHSWAQFVNDPWGFYPAPITHAALCHFPFLSPHYWSLLCSNYLGALRATFAFLIESLCPTRHPWRSL